MPAIVVLALAAVCVSAQAPENSPPAAKPADRGPVLVELFTSEGCPHCPEADALLEKLYTDQSVEGAQIIALEEHVDYWNRPSWVDHYSSPVFTQRQQGYADAMDLESLYTPQMVVDGLVEFVGNNAPRARAAISALGRAPLPVVLILPATERADAKRPTAARLVRLEAHDLSHPSPSEVYLALAEDKLFSRVNGGSNAGESWPHSSIAHWFHLAGKVAAGSTEFSMVAEIQAPEAGWRVENLRLVAFVQEAQTLRILALGSARLTDVMPLAGPVPKAAVDSSNGLREAFSTGALWATALSATPGGRP